MHIAAQAHSALWHRNGGVTPAPADPAAGTARPRPTSFVRGDTTPAPVPAETPPAAGSSTPASTPTSTPAGARASAPASAEAFFSALLARNDADGDGQLAAGEMAGGRAAGLMSKAIARLDSSGDGLVSQDEFVAAADSLRATALPQPAPPGLPPATGSDSPAGLRAAIDADGDGALSSAELSGFLDTVLPPAPTALSALSLRAEAQQAPANPAQLVQSFLDALGGLAQEDGG